VGRQPHEALGDEKPAGLIASWVRFWFTATDPLGLHVLRVATGILLLVWLLSFANRVDAFFGLDGWFDRQAYREIAKLPEGAPVPITWSLVYLFPTGGALKAYYWASVAVLALFTLGIAPRITGVLSWLAVASFVGNPALAYDADWLLVILAFYLMVGYLLFGLWNGNLSPAGLLLGPCRVSLLRRPSLASSTSAGSNGSNDRPPSVAANFTIRLLQVQFALIIFVSGLHKLQFGEWWGATALWYPLVPALQTTLPDIKAYASNGPSWLLVINIATYAVLVWQITFPLFAWRKRWRPVLIGGAVVGWLGMAFVYHLPLFGPIYLIGCLSFLTPGEWQGLANRLGRWVGLNRNPSELGTRSAERGTPEAPHSELRVPSSI
jgi:hypothetical protein